MARLLAFGGNAFVERRWIGDWPPFGAGVLGDFFGLGADRTAFGCGLAGGSPFLVWRTLQNKANRGGYPYTVLLDPGFDIWQVFEFNAAALLSAMLADTECADGLVSGIDGVTPDWLERVLGRLRPAASAAPRPDSSPAASTWVWSAVHADRASSIRGIPPGIDECARWLAELPICFRLAGGWLSSGCLLHAQTYGIRLVFDAEGGQAIDERQQKEAEALLWRWRAAEVHPQMGSAVRALSSIPVEWWGSPAKGVFREIAMNRNAALSAIARRARERVDWSAIRREPRTMTESAPASS